MIWAALGGSLLLAGAGKGFVNRTAMLVFWIIALHLVIEAIV